MALSVPLPANSFTEFGWLFHNNHFDNSQECDIMELSDSSVEYQCTQPQQQTNSRSYYMGDSQNFNGGSMQNKFSIDLDSPSDSKEPWTADYVKSILHAGPTSEANGNRKRKTDWSQIQHHGDFSIQLVDNGPMTKIPTQSKDRRKSQGRLQWPDDIDLDLSAELMNGNQYSNDSMLNFPNLTVFKQEVPSPPNIIQQTSSRSPTQISCVRVTQQMQTNGLTANGGGDQNGSGSTSSSNGLANLLDQLDGNQGNGNSGSNVNREGRNLPSNDDCRFQYVLAAATSIATKSNEETLTYLNQGQSYEIKLKKLGDLSSSRGKIMKSVIKICFHERRLQYMEREQIQIWQSSRPGERILDIDIPLSYGLIHVNQAALLNTAEILWDPMKEVGVYIKVNCISTEFTPKKHGGEKGVPFRIQIETYLENGTAENASTKPLHGAACQIKVFKLKGADRKHKQDRERIQKRPASEQDKYQRSYDCTIFNDISSDHPVSSTIGCYSPEHIKRNMSPVLPSSPIHVPSNLSPVIPFNSNITIGNVSSTNVNLVASTQSSDSDEIMQVTITKDMAPQQLSQWLSFHRLTAYASTFSHFSGSDLLRMSKDDLIQICGIADGIRMFNIIHAKTISPRLTIYVELELNTYHAIYLHSTTTRELVQKLYKVPGIMDRATNSGIWKFSSPSSPSQLNSSNPNLNDDSNFKIYIYGPNNVMVLVTDEVLANIKDESLFALDVNPTNGSILMKTIIGKTKNGGD